MNINIRSSFTQTYFLNLFENNFVFIYQSTVNNFISILIIMSSQRINDLMQSTASENEIKFYFITKSGTIDEASEDLKYSFEVRINLLSTRKMRLYHFTTETDYSWLCINHRELALVVREWLSSVGCINIDKAKCFRIGGVWGRSF